jgi:hypothetical protein
MIATVPTVFNYNIQHVLLPISILIGNCSHVCLYVLNKLENH